MSATDLQARLQQMLAQINPTGKSPGLLERLQRDSVGIDAAMPDLSSERVLESLGVPTAAENQAEIVAETLEALNTGNDLSAEQQFQLEAIVMPFHRPVVDVIQDALVADQLTDDWQKYGDEGRRPWIIERTRAIGRINVPTLKSLPYAGTGFIVGPGLLMTNRHVAAIFAQGLGLQSVRIPAGTESVIEFSDSGDTQPTSLKVREVVMIHPHWDMALLRVEGLPVDRRPLALSTTDPGALYDREVAVIGYPGYDPTGTEQYQEVQKRVFNGRYYIKRFQPGRFRLRERIESFKKNVDAVTHDCSTLGGNSGSAVIDLTTGEVVGLHFGGIYLKANYAVSPRDLAEDSRVVNAGVNFRGRVEPRSDFYGPIWSQIEELEMPAPVIPAPPSQPQATTALQVQTGTATWTIPLQISINVGTPTIVTTPVAISKPVTSVEGAFGSGPAIIIPDARFAIGPLQGAAFDFPAGLSLGLASRLSYRTEAEVVALARDVWGLEACFFSVDDTQCFAARVGSTVIVSFRGTESRGDWLGNLNMLSTTRPYGTVHRGFLGAFQVVDALLQQQLTEWNGSSIWLTGHSLGGALATIAAAEWQGRYPITGVATYGQPAVGKGAFGDFMKRNYGGRFFRYVNDDDIVPRVPPTYRHVGQLIHFTAAGVPRISLESLVGDDLLQPAVVSDTEPPMLTEAEFDRMRAELLAENARAQEAGLESLPTAQLEGLLPSISDHSLDRYLTKIAKQIPTSPA